MDNVLLNGKNNKFEGKGIYYFNEKNKYDAEYKNNLKEGKRIFYYNHRDKYEGEWKNDKRE